MHSGAGSATSQHHRCPSGGGTSRACHHYLHMNFHQAYEQLEPCLAFLSPPFTAVWNETNTSMHNSVSTSSTHGNQKLVPNHGLSSRTWNVFYAYRLTETAHA
eukprot:355066-Chlamydomonas_euryale.AAC.1